MQTQINFAEKKMLDGRHAMAILVTLLGLMCAGLAYAQDAYDDAFAGQTAENKIAATGLKKAGGVKKTMVCKNGEMFLQDLAEGGQLALQCMLEAIDVQGVQVAIK